MGFKIIAIGLVLFSLQLGAQKCNCGQGNGAYRVKDEPTFTHFFDNGSGLAICGWQNKKSTGDTLFMSDFTIFNCSSSKALKTYSAVHSCEIYFVGDTIKVDRIKYFYNGNSSKWKSFALAQVSIIESGDSIEITDEQVVLSIQEFVSIDKQSVINADFASMNYQEISAFLGKLEILALREDKDAIALLFSDKLRSATNAASLEHLLNIQATYNWVVKKSTENYHW
jgi:hypothetical protein